MAEGDAPKEPTVDDFVWFHSIDLGHGVVTSGQPPSEFLDRVGVFPDVRGKTVLDIGAWDGKYSFRAEQRGARRVVALDHYVWQLDWAARDQYLADCLRQGITPDPDLIDHGFLDPNTTPGRRPFDFARQALASRVEPLVADFTTCPLEELGTFDVVLYLGVLYHMRDPLTALQRVRKVTTEMAVIETDAVRVLGHGKSSLLAFYGGSELSGDWTNWFAPTELALHEMCKSVGFSRVETMVGPPPVWSDIRRRWNTMRIASSAERYRLVVHAFV